MSTSREQPVRNFSSFYEENQAVYETLLNIDPSAYEKYIDWLSLRPGATILEVGCGIGYVANEMARRGYNAYGVDANRIAIEQAQKGPGTFTLLGDYRLPYADGFFDVVGSYTVIEHVGDPETFLDEQVRVLKAGGRLVVACPNFLKFAGVASHHPRTRGFPAKVRNAVMLAQKALRYALTKRYSFEMMEPIVRERFEPDDDAIVVTNPVDICAALRVRGLSIVYAAGTERYWSPLLEKISRMPFIRSVVGSVFVVGEKR